MGCKPLTNVDGLRVWSDKPYELGFRDCESLTNVDGLSV